MGIRFSADEVFEMAAQIERNGELFYRRAAENNEEGREMLTQLAEEEVKHLAIFESMRGEFSREQTDSTVFDPDGQASLYLKAIADGHVFDLERKTQSAILRGDEALSEIISTALRAEKDSIAFFVGMKELIPNESGKDKVSLLIKEEMQHIAWLNEQRLARAGT